MSFDHTGIIGPTGRTITLPEVRPGRWITLVRPDGQETSHWVVDLPPGFVLADGRTLSRRDRPALHLATESRGWTIRRVERMDREPVTIDLMDMGRMLDEIEFSWPRLVTIAYRMPFRLDRVFSTATVR